MACGQQAQTNLRFRLCWLCYQRCQNRSPVSRAAAAINKKTDYLQQSFRDNLQAFSHQRAVLIGTLSPSGVSDWARGATFTATTLGREATVLSYAIRIADHEVRHLDQLRRTVKG